MNLFKKFRSALSRCLEPKRNKNGSSLAFVMVVGAVLVIWVLCIMPLMTAVGTNGIAMSGSYSDYLQSRSAIEFCKSELEHIVLTGAPYTFCVVRDNDGIYTAIPKRGTANEITGAYDQYINYDPANIDTNDTPLNNADGKLVVAICAVSSQRNEENAYPITITTYNDCQKGLTYNTTYTIRGNLLINPESYQQSQALPLSDFVLVDGKLGNKTIWNSNIHAIAAVDFKNVTNLATIFETLLPVGNEDQADAGEYPAVLKTTAYPSGVTKPNPLNGSEFILVSTSNNAVYVDGNSLKVERNFNITNYQNDPDNPSFDKYQWRLIQDGAKYKLYNIGTKKYLLEDSTWYVLYTKYEYKLTDRINNATQFSITINKGETTIQADRYLSITASTVEPVSSRTFLHIVPKTSSANAGHAGNPVDSIMQGSSLYFMGRNSGSLLYDEFSIDTCGVNIHLKTDLLVLRHGIKGNGQVIVTPYSSDLNYDSSQADTLLFAVNSFENASGFVFNARTFYWIPAGTDINKMTSTPNNRPPLALDDEDHFEKLKFLLRKGDYPEINMDIAYVDREQTGESENGPIYGNKFDDDQLAHIVSGETIGWTDDGEMVAGNDRNFGNRNEGFDSTNRKFIVCAYVSSIENAKIQRTANRIMLVAEETLERGSKSKTLSVPNNLQFTCRYFSISADYIIQTGTDNYLRIKNLGQDKTFVDLIISFLGLQKYSSKTMQVEFEQTTRIQQREGQLLSPVKPAGIYRVEHPDLDDDSLEGIDLFQTYATSDYTAPELIVKYTNDDIKTLLTNWLSANSRIVERYVSVGAGNTMELTVESRLSSKLTLYTNYISFKNDVVRYKLEGNWLSEGIFINSQERGYAEEYAGFFGGGSAESYNGTIIHIAANDEYTTRQENGIYINGTFLSAGFYYIPASKNGTNITELAKLPEGVFGTFDDIDMIHRINPADLPKYSIYINPDGTMSNAYVDTGLIGNSDLGESGFSGGNVG